MIWVIWGITTEEKDKDINVKMKCLISGQDISLEITRWV